MKEISVRTTTHTQLVNITSQVTAALAELDPAATLCHVFVPHTTAAVVINEAADPDVARDLAAAYQAMVPKIPFCPRRGQLRLASPGHPARQLGDHAGRQRPTQTRHLAGDLLCRSRWAADPTGVGEHRDSYAANRESEVVLTTLLACLVIHVNRFKY